MNSLITIPIAEYDPAIYDLPISTERLEPMQYANVSLIDGKPSVSLSRELKSNGIVLEACEAGQPVKIASDVSGQQDSFNHIQLDVRKIWVWPRTASDTTEWSDNVYVKNPESSQLEVVDTFKESQSAWAGYSVYMSPSKDEAYNDDSTRPTPQSLNRLIAQELGWTNVQPTTIWMADIERPKSTNAVQGVTPEGKLMITPAWTFDLGAMWNLQREHPIPGVILLDLHWLQMPSNEAAYEMALTWLKFRTGRR